VVRARLKDGTERLPAKGDVGLYIVLSVGWLEPKKWIKNIIEDSDAEIHFEEAMANLRDSSQVKYIGFSLG